MLWFTESCKALPSSCPSHPPPTYGSPRCGWIHTSPKHPSPPSPRSFNSAPSPRWFSTSRENCCTSRSPGYAASSTRRSGAVWNAGWAGIWSWLPSRSGPSACCSHTKSKPAPEISG